MACFFFDCLFFLKSLLLFKKKGNNKRQQVQVEIHSRKLKNKVTMARVGFTFHFSLF